MRLWTSKQGGTRRRSTPVKIRHQTLRKSRRHLFVQSPQKIVPSPRKFTEDPLCDVQEPSERSRHTCGTSLESSMLNLSLIHMRSFGAGSGPEAMNHGNGAPGAAAPPVARPKDTARPKRFHGSITLDATRVGRDASRVADEVIAHLAGLVGSSVKRIDNSRRHASGPGCQSCC